MFVRVRGVSVARFGFSNFECKQARIKGEKNNEQDKHRCVLKVPNIQLNIIRKERAMDISTE